MDCTRTNGRVNITGPVTSVLFSMQDRVPVSQCAGYRDAMVGNWYNTRLSDAFFSERNIQVIQNGLRAGVYQMSHGQYTVAEQNCDELKIIMRSVFLQYSKNLPGDIAGQIAVLNAQVLSYAVKQVYGEAQGYMRYKQDVSTLVVPLPAPVLSYTNDKQLELKHFF
jgi:hypothetical protein